MLGKRFSCIFTIISSLLNRSSLAIDDITHSVDRCNTCVAYVYFDYKNREEQTRENVVRILLKQLLLPSNLTPPDLESAYDEYCSHHKDPESAIFRQQLLSTSVSFSSVYVMLDALDECGSETLEDIIALIGLLRNSGVKVFCTSRTHLMNLNEQLDTSTILINAQDEDVRNYLNIRLNKEWRHDPRFREQIIIRLTTGAEGKSVAHFLCLCRFSDTF